MIVDPSVDEPLGFERERVRRRIASGAATETEVDGAALIRRFHRTGIAPEAVTLGRGWQLACTDGLTCDADVVAVEPDSGRIEHVVARCGGLGPPMRKRRVAPASAIQSIGDDEIVLTLSHAEIEALPDLDVTAQPAGQSLALAIQDALDSDPQTAHLSGQVRAFARDGAVELVGTVASPHDVAAVDRVAASVPGATRTLNALVIRSDGRSSPRAVVVAALGVLSRTGESVIDVHESAGAVTLTGVVPDRPTHDEAVAIAGAVAGVSLVVDDLRVGTEEPALEPAAPRVRLRAPR